jgi:hypothetical protein
MSKFVNNVQDKIAMSFAPRLADAIFGFFRGSHNSARARELTNDFLVEAFNENARRLKTGRCSKCFNRQACQEGKWTQKCDWE